MKLPAPLIKSWRDIQLNFDALARDTTTPTRRVFDIPSGTSTASIPLGNFDGDKITGIRLTWGGVMVGAAGTNLWLRPNGLASINTGQTIQRAYKNGTGLAMATDLQGADAGAQSGLLVGMTDWGVTANSVAGSGFLFTRTQGAPPVRRFWHGTYWNQDVATDTNRQLQASIASYWNDWTTPITSLALDFVGGGMVFTGKVMMEILP